IARAHFLVRVIVRRIFRINNDVTIVIRRTRIIAPNVGLGDLMIGVVAAGRKVWVVSEDFTDLKDSRRRAAVSLFFVKTCLALPCESGSPREATLAKQHRKRPGHYPPVAAARTLKQTQVATH